MSDQFELLRPGSDLVKDKYLISICNEYNELRILLKAINKTNRTVQITFKSHIIYRTSNESFRLRSLQEGKFENGINYSNDSRFLNWIKEESAGIFDDMNPVHYLICSNDDITDVVSLDEPIIDWL